MVSFYILNPAQKLHFLSKLFVKGSKRILKDINSSSALPSTSPQVEEVKHTRRPKINVLNLTNFDWEHISPTEGLIRDLDYYKDDSESGFCIFRVEDTLFKVHKCYLLREPSAFQDMLYLPIPEGTTPKIAPVLLYDTAEQFRDLLWAIYAPPIELASVPGENSLTIGRLLNIAELANKYCLASYETWALQCILTLSKSPAGFLRSASPELCARALNVAVLANHDELLDVVTQRLIARMLWTDVGCGPIFDVAQRRGLRRLQGVAHYKELILLETQTGLDGSDEARTLLAQSIRAEKRAGFLSAHHSLVNLWECVRMTPPTFIDNGCTSHTECLTSWTEMWLGAACASQTLSHGSADVLGRLKTMMLLLKRSMKAPTSPISLDCTLAALESITVLRDDVVFGLLDHFQEC